jgi:predicted membrane protein
MENKTKFRLTPQLLLGLIVIFLGVIFTLENLDLVDAGNYIRYWPAAFVLLGLFILGESRDFPGRLTGVFVSLAGCLLLLGNLDYIRFYIWDFWPLVLVYVGVNIIWQSYYRRGKLPRQSHNTISGFAILSGLDRTCSSQDFQGGELTAFMGGCEVDLRQASIEADQAVINTFAFWGGIEIRVPEDWTVTCKVFPLMGGVDEKTATPEGGPRKNLLIQGFAIMGGVEIRN